MINKEGLIAVRDQLKRERDMLKRHLDTPFYNTVQQAKIAGRIDGLNWAIQVLTAELREQRKRSKKEVQK